MGAASGPAHLHYLHPNHPRIPQKITGRAVQYHVWKTSLKDAFRTQIGCWVLIDEAHSLKRLPVLETALVEGRKHNIKIDHRHAEPRPNQSSTMTDAAPTIIAASHTKIFQRTNEVESARWVSEMIGQQRDRKPRVSTTASVQTYGRDSLNYAPGIEQHYVVSTEQIMALENLKGYWKYGDAVVPFRIEPMKRPKRAPRLCPPSTLATN